MSHDSNRPPREGSAEELESRLVELSRAKDLMAALIDSMTDEVWFADTRERFALANPSARREFGLVSEEVAVGALAASLEVLRPDGTPRPVEEAPPLRALRGELVRNAEEIIRTPATGELRHRQVSASPVRDAAGEIIGSVSVARDVTEVKQAEAAVRDSEARFRSVLQASVDCLYRLNLQTGHYEFISPAAASIVGFSPEEFARIDSADALSMIHPADVAAMQAALLRLEDTGEADAEYRQRTSDGTYRWVSNHLKLTRDADGRGLYRDGTIRDISRRKHREERVQELSRFYAVLSRVNETIVRTREPAELYREVCRIIAEGLGRPLVWIGTVCGTRVIVEAASGRALEYVSQLRVETEGEYGAGPSGTSIREGRAVVNDDFDLNPTTRPWRESARKFNLRASASFPLRKQGAVIGALTLYASEPGTFTPDQVGLLEALSADVSYALDKMAQEKALEQNNMLLRQANERLEQDDRRKNEFLAVLSHELRNPLAPIRNSLQILDRAEPGCEQASRALDVIDRQISHMSALVDDLLDMTRIKRNKIHLHREPLDLNAAVERAVEDSRCLFDDAGVRLELRKAPQPVRVLADRTRVSQIVGNLLQNAAKFTGAGGRTCVSVAAEGERATVRVSDDGIGMTADVMGRLFHPFVQAEQPLDRSKGGLGLGLALVKGLVELHGGTVQVQSEGAGRGTVFSVRLPVEPGAAQSRPVAAPAPSAPGRQRVLIIEDNVDAADSLRELLELEGHDVVVAHNGRRGVELAKAHQPRVVLCDIGLPGMDGYAVARAIRSEPGLQSMRLIALSGYALPEDLERARLAGFDGHLAKPATLEKLYEAVGAAPRSGESL